MNDTEKLPHVDPFDARGMVERERAIKTATEVEMMFVDHMRTNVPFRFYRSPAVQEAIDEARRAAYAPEPTQEARPSTWRRRLANWMFMVGP